MLEQMHLHATLLRKLVSDVVPSAAAAETAEDLRLGPTLPHASLIASARDFDDLGRVKDAFESFRATHRSTLHSSSATSADAPTTLKARKLQQDRIANRIANQSKGGTKDPAPWASGMSFARCLLTLADPTSQLLSAEDAERCLAAFVERATASLARDAEAIAKAYVQEKLQVAKAASSSSASAAASVVETLADPLSCLTDAGLNDAAVLHMARLLRVTLVVRKGPPGTPCVVFPATGHAQANANAQAAALIRWNPATGAFFGCDRGTLEGVQSELLRTEDAGALQSRLEAMAPFERRKVSELKDVCECAAIVAAGKTKAAYAEALSQKKIA